MSAVRPSAALERATIESMCAPVAGGRPLGKVTAVEGGLVNTLLRVTTADGTDYALRVSTGQRDDELGALRFAREISLIERLSNTLPVPRPVVVDLTGDHCGAPYLLYRWIHGVMLNEFRRKYGLAALIGLAEPVGHVVGAIAVADAADDIALPRLTIPDAIRTADEQLDSARVRARLGIQPADDFRGTLVRTRPALEAHDDVHVLVHGDLSGRNIIVRGDASDRWDVSGVLDWETASLGSPLWDLGSLFRYWRRYDAEFRRVFERAYGETGFPLPDEWWYLARVLDATRLVAILADDRELPHVFEDCREILSDLAAGS